MRKQIFLLQLAIFTALLFAVSGCARPTQPPLPKGNVSVGVAYFSQPRTSAEMLAGFIGEEVPVVDEEVFAELDVIFRQTLRNKSDKHFVPADKAFDCSQKIIRGSNEYRAALRRWAAVGRCMNVDALVVPQVYEWRQREGSGAGVVRPARIVLAFFTIDTRSETLIARSHFEETQQALTDNLLNTRQFFKRGARWVTAEELSVEAMERAIKELGL